MITAILILTAICTSVQFGFMLAAIFVARHFIKDVWKYWTEPLHVYEAN